MLFQLSLLFFTALGGGGLALWLQKYDPKVLKLIMALTGAFLFGVVMIHLLPEVYAEGGHIAGVWILGGFLMQISLEFLSHGATHGHIHKPHGHGPAWVFGLSLLLGLSLHAFMEGMPISYVEGAQVHEHVGHSHTHGHSHSGTHIWLGVLFHKAPEAFSLVMVLLAASFSLRNVILLLVSFSLMSPLGGLVASWLHGQALLGPEGYNILMALVTGSFLHISTTILFETEETSHSFNWRKMLAVLLGFGLALAGMMV